MESIYYSMIGIIAIVLHVIINSDLILKSNNEKSTSRIYKQFLTMVLVYYITDTLWGIISYLKFSSLLYCDTVAYYIAMGFSVVFWCRYVIEYLKLEKLFGKLLNLFGMFFCISEILILAINHFKPVFFSIDGNCAYKAYFFRYAMLAIQIGMFAIIAFQSFVVAIKSKDEYKRRNITIALFGYSMAISALIQVKYPLLPIYTIGLMLGICLIHVFVQEDEKEEIRKEFFENSEIIENAGYGIWQISMENGHNKMTANKKLQSILGILDKNLSPEELYEYYHSRLMDKVSEIESDDYASMLNGNMRSRLLCWNHPEKGFIYLRAGGNVRTLSNGKQIISGYCGDITEQKLAEDELNAKLEKAKYQAEAANNAKTAFLFNMSHDIRTPMNAIIGFRDLVEKYQDDPVRRADYLEKIKTSSSVLLSIINNVLEMARIEKGTLEVEEDVRKAESLIDSIGIMFDEMMLQKNIELTAEINVTHHFIMCDVLKLREVFMNIISNAYKYTNAGGKIHVSLKELPGDKEGYLYYQTTVSDTGIGMSKEFLPHIFEEFSREKCSTDIKIEGTGLGMPIVKRLVEFMGGKIEVQSEKDVGTKVTVTIPHKIAKEEESNKAQTSEYSPELFKGKRILLVEDNELNAEIATEILKDAGFMIDHVADGNLCVEKVKSVDSKYYDLILMDIQMPNMNGYEATLAIRSLKDKGKANIPIIAMTANAFEEDKKSAIKVGMNGHVSKPIDVPALKKEIALILNK